MSEKFVEMLAGATNTLGRTEEAVALVLQSPERIEELYQCYFQPDEWVRLRVSSSFKRLWRADPDLVEPYIPGFIADVSKIDQPSANWTFSQLCLEMQDHLSDRQKKLAIRTMKQYLKNSKDWIVQNATIETLAIWADDSENLKTWLVPRLEKFSQGDKKSVAKRAEKWISKLNDN